MITKYDKFILETNNPDDIFARLRSFIQSVKPDVNIIGEKVYDYLAEYNDESPLGIYFDFGIYDPSRIKPGKALLSAPSNDCFISICDINTDDQTKENRNRSKDKDWFDSRRYGNAYFSIYGGKLDLKYGRMAISGKYKQCYNIRICARGMSTYHMDLNDERVKKVIKNVNNATSVVSRLSKSYSVNVISSEYFSNDANWTSYKYPDFVESANISIVFEVK